MDFTPGALFASMVIGTVGMGFLIYGKRAQRMPQLVTGVALMVYPYFVSSTAWMVTVGVIIVGGLFAAVRAGL